MSFEINSLLPAIVLILGLVAALVAELAARAKADGGDTGTYWSRIAARTCVAIAAPLLALYLIVTAFPDARASIPGVDRQEYWLFAPLLPWSLLLVLGLFQAAPAAAGRWLAGSIGYQIDRRGWAALCALPLAGLLAMGWSRLGNAPSSYPAANWTTAALLSITLLAVARSKPAAAAAAAAEAPAEQAKPGPSLPDWPEAMRAGGVALADLFSRPASLLKPRPTASDRLIAEWRERIAAKGSLGVSDTLLEAVHELTRPQAVAPGAERNRLILAPDNCGQHEVVGLAAADLSRKLGEATLIITPWPRPDLTERIKRWAAPPEGSTELPARVAAPRSWKDLQEAGDADVWIVDAETLSDRLLPRLRYEANKPNLQQRNLVSRIGMVVWWDVHAYTGALAANIWAISRRLHRIIRAHGRPGVRALALARGAAYGNAELSPFLQRVLPYRFTRDQETRIETAYVRPLRAYRIEHDRELMRTRAADVLPERAKRLPLTAALVSTQSGWTTRLDAPPHITAIERESLEKAHLGDDAIVADRLTTERPEAGASILPITEASALSLPEMLCQGARSTPAGPPHCVGILPPDNPYLEYLLQAFDRDDSPWRSSRLLIRAEGNPNIVRRHLLHALYEVEETRRGLETSLGWNRDILLATLRELAGTGQLIRREVLFLDDEGLLQADWLCRNDQPPDSRPRPLRTVSSELIEVRNLAAGDVEEAVPLEVDPDRAGIEAYPGKVFVTDGRRYRIDEWQSHQTVKDRRQIACEQTDQYLVTWRQRYPQIQRLQKVGDEITLEGLGVITHRFVADAVYREHLDGWLERDGSGRLDLRKLERPVRTSFTTRTLTLSFDPAPDEKALDAMAAAFRLMLPVHLGADDDSLEVVAIHGLRAGRDYVHGVAIVDLYPGGIGLVEAIEADNALLQNIFKWTHQWLREVAREGLAGADRLSASPLVRAAEGDATLDFAAAEELLARLSNAAHAARR
ncbi:MAG: hypothetical protein GC160_07850 [Acidobacteria bacterium]|nr:hypothetical protein [Acidobacteriota bacterium]